MTKTPHEEFEKSARTQSRNVVQRLACVASAALAVLGVQGGDSSGAGERVLSLVASSSLEERCIEPDEDPSRSKDQPRGDHTYESPEEQRKTAKDWRAETLRVLSSFRVKQQLIDWEQEWSLARKLQAKLAERHLDLAQEITAAKAELQSIVGRENEYRQDLVVWRLVEADPVNQSIRLRLGEQQARRDVLAKEFIEGSVWLSREDALLAVTTGRLRKTPEELEKARVTMVDPVAEWLRARRCQVEVALDRLRARARLVAAHLQSVSGRLATYRSIAEHYRRFLDAHSIQEPDQH